MDPNGIYAMFILGTLGKPLRNKHPALNEPGVMIMNNPEEAWAWAREAWDFSIILDGFRWVYRDNNWISIGIYPLVASLGMQPV